MAEVDDGVQLALWSDDRNGDRGTRKPGQTEVREPEVRTALRLDGTGRSSPAQSAEVPTNPDELWDIDAVANYLEVPRQTIYAWRQKGYGPPGFRVGRHLRWRAAAVVAWTVERERVQ